MTAGELATLVTSLLLCDRRATEAVLAFRVPCGPGLAAHPSGVAERGAHGTDLISVLGLLNAALEGTDRVVVVYDDRRRHVLRVDVLPKDFG